MNKKERSNITKILGKDLYKKLKKINSPKKIQDYLNSIPWNYEINGETISSPIISIQRNNIHCLEGALIATLLFKLNNTKSWLIDLKGHKDDLDHIITIWKEDGYYGAISKTNHNVLRYREPVYKSVRELVMSYFHEYFLDDGRKTLESYSLPFEIDKFIKDLSWINNTKNLWELSEKLDNIPHKKILNTKQKRNLRKADKVEIEAGKILEWSKIKS